MNKRLLQAIFAETVNLRYTHHVVMLRNILLYAVCLIMLFGSLANAAAPCCCMPKASDHVQMQAEHSDHHTMAAEMPCHEMGHEASMNEHSKQDTPADADDCASCGCAHLVQATILPDFPHIAVHPSLQSQDIRTDSVAIWHPDAVLQPPKTLS